MLISHFPTVMTRRTYFTIKSLSVGDYFLFSQDLKCFHSGVKFNTGCSEGLILDRTVLKSVNLTSIGIKARYDVSP